MALRALSSGRTTAINSGRSSISSSARTVKTLNLARPITRPTFLSRPRIWFSRSRLILTSKARLASSALTEWLSRSLTRTSLNQPVCMMRAIPAASLRSLLLNLEYRLGVARIDTDHRQAKLFELGPQPCGRWSCLRADPYRSRCLRSHECSDRLRIGIDYALSHDRSRLVRHTDRCLLQRHV